MSLHLVPRALTYIEQVARLGSIQAASREIGISASAIHRQVASVEDDLGELIFDRDAKGMSLTPAGRLILDMARNWRFDSAKLWSLMEANRGVEHGQIRVAAMDGMVNGLALELACEVGHRLPQVELKIEITTPDAAIKGLLNGDFDLAAVANAMPDDSLVVHWSKEFPLGCIAAPGHPTAGKKNISLKEFISFPIAVQDKSLPIRKLLEARHGWIFENASNSIVVSSVQLMKWLVLSGKYVAITSEVDAGPEIGSGRLNFIPISDKDTFEQSFSLLSNIQKSNSTACQKVIGIAEQILNHHKEPMSERTPF